MLLPQHWQCYCYSYGERKDDRASGEQPKGGQKFEHNIQSNVVHLLLVPVQDIDRGRLANQKIYYPGYSSIRFAGILLHLLHRMGSLDSFGLRSNHSRAERSEKRYPLLKTMPAIPFHLIVYQRDDSDIGFQFYIIVTAYPVSVFPPNLFHISLHFEGHQAGISWGGKKTWISRDPRCNPIHDSGIIDDPNDCFLGEKGL